MKNPVNQVLFLMLFVSIAQASFSEASSSVKNGDRSGGEEGFDYPLSKFSQIPDDLWTSTISPFLDLQNLLSLSNVHPLFEELTAKEIQRKAQAEIAFLTGGLVKIDKGSFILGPAEGEEAYQNETRRFVTLQKDYWIMVDPVTQAQYEFLMGSEANLSLFRGMKLPVTSLNHDRRMSYISKLNHRLNELWPLAFPKAPNGVLHLELPTEEQWELATTAPLAEPESVELNGQTVQITARHMKYSGTNEDSEIRKYAVCEGVFTQGPSDVDSVLPNQRGIRGLSGNISEVTSSPITQIRGSLFDGGFIRRGSHWYGNLKSCRSSNRNYVFISDIASDIGFRLVGQKR